MLRTLTAAFLLAAAGLMAVPGATAYQPPPQCMTVDQCCGIEPGFAPCCSVAECPPPIARCPLVAFDTTDYPLLAGPSMSVSVASDCTAEACLETACCTLDGEWSRCSSVASAQGLCPSERHFGGIDVYILATCEVIIEVKQYDCVWNCGWVTYVQGPPVTLRVYEQTDGETSSASSIELPNPCGPTANCQPPTCTQQELVSEGLPFSVVVRVDGDCGGAVSVSGVECPAGTVQGQPLLQVEHVPVTSETCQPDLVCTCDPILEPAAAQDLPSLDDLFQQCMGVGGCCGIEPAEGGCCSPTCPVTLCQEKSVSTTDFFAYLGPHATVAVHSDCTVDASEHGLPCSSLAPDRRAFDRTVGPVQVHADLCLPVLDCTCPPMQAPSADLQPPVEVEFVVCVTDPCPPQVTCHVRPGQAGPYSYEVSPSCHLTLREEPLVVCEGYRTEQATFGPVTVVRTTCGPGIQE